MKRMLRIVALAALWLVTTAPGLAQQRPQSRMQRPAQSEAQRARNLYQRCDTWYEFLLKQFNPDNLDYGAWLVPQGADPKADGCQRRLVYGP